MNSIDIEYRAIAFDGKPITEAGHIVGRAIAYNSLSKPMKTASGDEYVEIIAPEALKRSLETGSDVRALCEHNKDMLLGRTSNGTLYLENRADGLYVDITLPDTSYARDLRAMVERGDISGFSFGFNKAKQKTYRRGEMRIREIIDLNLLEVSVVSTPAYNATEATLRSMDGVAFEPEAVAIDATALLKHINNMRLL